MTICSLDRESKTEEYVLFSRVFTFSKHLFIAAALVSCSIIPSSGLLLLQPSLARVTCTGTVPRVKVPLDICDFGLDWTREEAAWRTSESRTDSRKVTASALELEFIGLLRYSASSGHCHACIVSV